MARFSNGFALDQGLLTGNDRGAQVVAVLDDFHEILLAEVGERNQEHRPGTRLPCGTVSCETPLGNIGRTPEILPMFRHPVAQVFLRSTLPLAFIGNHELRVGSPH